MTDFVQSFSLDMDFDDTTFDDIVEYVVSLWPYLWADYWGLSSSGPPANLTDDERAEIHELDRSAHRLVAAAAQLSRRKLPEVRRTLPGQLSSEATASRQMRDEALEMLRDDPDLSKTPLWQHIIEILKAESHEEWREGFFKTAVQIHAFKEFGYQPGSIAERLMTLLEFLVHTKSQVAQAYLQRVARCFVLDLPIELAIMSRAVLESALHDLPIEPVVVELMALSSKRYPSLIDWLNAAEKAGVLDPSGRRAAEVVKRAGDDAVHLAPGLTPEAIEHSNEPGRGA